MKKYALTFLCLFLTGMIVAGCSTAKNTSSLPETAGADSSEAVSAQSVEQTTSPAKESTTTSQKSSSSCTQSVISIPMPELRTDWNYSSRISTITAVSSLTKAQIIQVIEGAYGIKLPASSQLLPGGKVKFTLHSMPSLSEQETFIEQLIFFDTVTVVFDVGDADAFIASIKNDNEWKEHDEDYAWKYHKWVLDIEHPKGFTFYEKFISVPYGPYKSQTHMAVGSFALFPDAENHSYTFVADGSAYNYTNYNGLVEIK